MQEKTGKLEESPALFGVKTNSSKTKIMRVNSKSNTPIIMYQYQLDDVASFTYHENIISADGGTGNF